MMKIAISNQKGGVGKTTTTKNLGHELAQKGHKILLVDFDPQASLTKSYEISIKKDTPTALQFVMDQSDARIKINEQIDLIPASEDLQKLQSLLNDSPDGSLYLQYALNDIGDEYDYILIDCPPQKTLLTNNCYAAADSLIIPIKPGMFSIDGLVILHKQINTIKKIFNPALTVKGFLICDVNLRTNAKKDIENMTSQCTSIFDTTCFETIIPHSTAVSDAETAHMTIAQFRKNSKPAIAYRNLCLELLGEAYGNQ